MKITAKEIMEAAAIDSSMYVGDFKEYFNQLLDWPNDDYEYTMEDFGDELSTADNRMHEIADSMVSVYTGDQLEWYQEDIRRVAYMDDYIQSFGAENTDIYQILSGGIYQYHLEMLYSVYGTLQEFYDDWEDNFDDEEDDEE